MKWDNGWRKGEEEEEGANDGVVALNSQWYK